MTFGFGDRRLPDRFWSKVAQPLLKSGCWLWKAARNRDGYGMFSQDRVMRLAHRIAYEALVGAIAREHQLDHLCRVRACVNPDHLEPVTLRENQMRGETILSINLAKTECPRGHAYDEVNTYFYPATGGRRCRACAREYQRRLRSSRRDSIEVGS